jgi:NADH dehydrogenase
MDLGPGQALFTTGWERTVSKTGQEAKAIKERIVLERIVPPRDLEAALAASTPPAG